MEWPVVEQLKVLFRGWESGSFCQYGFFFFSSFMILPGILQTTRSKETSEDLREHPGLFRELYKDLS